MTRVNVGIDPRELPRAALLAEHREMIRIPNKVASGKYVNLNNAPKNFTLGDGHELFFTNKLAYLKRRYIAVYDACIENNYNVESYITAFDGISDRFMNEYTPTERDRHLLLERLSIRKHILKHISDRDLTL